MAYGPIEVLFSHIVPTCACSLCGLCTRARALKKEKLEPRLTPPTESYVGEGFVSVVVPAYNEGDGIKLTLATIDELAQVLSCVRVVSTRTSTRARSDWELSVASTKLCRTTVVVVQQ